MIIELSDADDPRVAEYTHLTDVALRTRVEPERGVYIAESSAVMRRAVAAGHRPRSFLMAPRWLETMAPHIAAAPGTGGDPHGGEVPVFVADEPLLQRGLRHHRPVTRPAGSCARRPAASPR